MSTYKTVKAIDDFVRGCKTDLVWDKLTEVYLLCAATFPGILCKLKHAGTATLTNNNFVTGDYLAAGSGAGLVGDRTTKNLDSSQTITGAQIGTLSFGVYGTVSMDNLDGSFIGCRSASSVVQVGRASNIQHIHFGNPGRVDYIINESAAFLHGYATASDVRIFTNGSLKDSRGSAGTYTGTPATWKMFNNGLGEFTNARLSFGYYGVATWTDTDAANLSTRVNALMTALGTNVY